MHDCDLSALCSCTLIVLIKAFQGENDVDQLYRALCMSMLITLCTCCWLSSLMNSKSVLISVNLVLHICLVMIANLTYCDPVSHQIVYNSYVGQQPQHIGFIATALKMWDSNVFLAYFYVFTSHYCQIPENKLNGWHPFTFILRNVTMKIVSGLTRKHFLSLLWRLLRR